MILGSLLLFSIKKQAGTYEQPRLGTFSYTENWRADAGLRSDPPAKRPIKRSSVILACSPFFLHLATTLPKQQLLGI